MKPIENMTTLEEVVWANKYSLNYGSSVYIGMDGQTPEGQAKQDRDADIDRANNAVLALRGAV